MSESTHVEAPAEVRAAGDWTPLCSRIKQVAAEQPDVRPDHLRVYAVPDVADLTARGLAECTCGVRYSAAGGTCPNAAETRREAASGTD